MLLSDISVRRPVLAAVMSLLIVAFGIVAYQRLQVREYPDIDPPIVSIETVYPGASAAVVERRITQLVEDQISTVEAIHNVSSTSVDEVSTVAVEFKIDRDIDAAANDLREAISGLLDDLPDESDPPEITKQDASTEVMLWLNLTGEGMTPLQLADYADRHIQDRLSVLPGVARIRISGASRYAMRIWLDREALAARSLTVSDVEQALREQNVEFPAGAVQSLDRQFTVRLEREFRSADDFRSLVIFRGDDGYQVRLGEVARVEVGGEQPRLSFRGNGVPMVGVGIIKQSRANTLEVARAAKDEAEEIRKLLPSHMQLRQSYDTSVFIEASLNEVKNTLLIAVGLVIAVIYLFLGSIRATLVPAVTVPVSLIGTAILLYAFGFSINVLTLLALVLAIGLVVDDAIVVLENVYRRLENGESPLVAAYLGTRQVGFAVVATTLVLVAVFLPITFLSGDTGKLFTEFAVTMAVAVIFSSFVALTLSPMLASKVLSAKNATRSNPLTRLMDFLFQKLEAAYRWLLKRVVRAAWLAALLVIGVLGASWWLFKEIPSEFTPNEDRGAFFVVSKAPEGASFGYSVGMAAEIEERLMYLVDQGEAERLLVRVPRGFGSALDYNQVVSIVVLKDWAERRPADDIMTEVRQKLASLEGMQHFVIMRQGLTRGLAKKVQFVIGGPDYETLAEWRDTLLEEAAKNPGLVGLDYDYKESKPQLGVDIDRTRASDLGVSIAEIGRTLETLLGSRRVTTYTEDGEEYDVIVEGDWKNKRSPTDLDEVFVRSERSRELIPLSNLVTLTEFADSGSLNRYNRIRAITIEANLAEGYTLSEALDFLDQVAAEKLPGDAVIDYKGESLDLRESSDSVLFVFGLALLVVFLVLAAQFESFVHPFTIMLAVPVAAGGALFGLWITDTAQSIYSQIGMIMLVGLAAKNGILIVEFINQQRAEGLGFEEAVVEASTLRLRPVLMTGLTTVMGSLPLILTSGAGSETRIVVGTVILFGVAISTLFTLLVIPIAYRLLSRKSAEPGATSRRVDEELTAHRAATEATS
ncbi:efflux RND transporter permease subunit [Haloferula chungangensis]|uniref:Efflux RND transporter permease subunit n=1 Tax=Haloferula chungangensis TaxID=1048331 RepID=A0ABW2L4G3_9BACT